MILFLDNSAVNKLGIPMTLERARELITIQVNMGGGYNRNSVRILLHEVSQIHGQHGVDQLIQEFSLDELFGITLGQNIKL